MTAPGAPEQKTVPQRKWIPLVIALIVLIAGAWAAKALVLPGNPRNVLLMGVDEGKTRTDVLVLAHIDPKQNLVNLISIPRDTLVEIPCDGIKLCSTPDKIAHAHVYGGEQGPELTMRSIEKLLDIKVDNYVRVDYEGFEKVVDALGGVDIRIDKNMDYEDPYAHPPLKIHFKAGSEPQHLSGVQALNFVRFRADGMGDIGRVERTKRFFFAVADTLRKNGTLTRLPGLVSSLWPYVATDLDSAAAVSLARMAAKVKIEQVRVEMVPGRDDPTNNAGWVWLADKAKADELAERLIRNPSPPEPAEK